MGCCQGIKENDNGPAGGKFKAAASKASKVVATEPSNALLAQKLKFISTVEIFKCLPKDYYPMLASALSLVKYKDKEVIIRQGDEGSEFFIINSGKAAVTVNRGDGTGVQKVASLKAGEYFGERALLRDETRAATVSAETKLEAFRITRERFQGLQLHLHLRFASRKAVTGGGLQEIEKKPAPAKSDAEKDFIRAALQGNDNLKALTVMSDDNIQSLVEAAWVEQVPAGGMVIKQGDLSADYFYIVKEGLFEVLHSSAHAGTDKIRGRLIDDIDTVEWCCSADSDEPATHETSASSLHERGMARVFLAGSAFKKRPSKATLQEEMQQGSSVLITPGRSFGELALLYRVPRDETVIAKETSSVWVIDRLTFKSFLMTVSDRKIEKYMGWLNSVPTLQPLLAEERKAVAQAMVETRFRKDDIILEQGDPGSSFFILYDGDVNVIKDGKKQGTMSASLEAGTSHCFGERALLNDEPRTETVIVKSPDAKALVLERDSLNLLLGSNLEDIITRSVEAGVCARQSEVCSASLSLAFRDRKYREHVPRKDLTRVGFLGSGAFASVELWSHKETGQTYALKGMSKGYIVKVGLEERVMNERNVMMMTDSPFIIHLHETYNGTQMIYFLMEPALGGELYQLYNRNNLHGSDHHAKYYCAAVVLAFEHMHERRIVYRDLKPENLLLTAHGFLKICDMGLSKFLVSKTYTTCGTPDYFAPEIIDSSGHTVAVDWWCLGILLFELMAGRTPFESQFPMQIYSKVMKGIGKVTFPDALKAKPAGRLVKALLKKTPSDRLPMSPTGIKGLKEEEWFSSFPWAMLENGTLEAPFLPAVASNRDVSNFKAREDMPKYIPYENDRSGWDKDFATTS